ncbi:hypothetical protein ACP3WJ_23845, partial [Salmonella enterica]|uniref:hypothetical protein n=1 Tax=Salmonella enterica TaxID=28901 RepID=UPI003CF1DD2C
ASQNDRSWKLLYWSLYGRGLPMGSGKNPLLASKSQVVADHHAACMDVVGTGLAFVRASLV